MIGVFCRGMVIDSFGEAVFLDRGYLDLDEAVRAAHRVHAQRGYAILQEHAHWRFEKTPTHQWPTEDLPDLAVHRLTPTKVGDGRGWDYEEIFTAVFRIDPDRPLTAELLELMAKARSWNEYFRSVAESN